MKARTEHLVIGFFMLALLATPAHGQEPDREKAKSIDGEAVALARENDIDGAIEKVRKAIRADPTYELAHTRLGYLLLKKNELDEAMKSFEEALKIRAVSHAAKTGKGIVLSRKGDLAAAEAVLKDALSLNPDPVRTHYELGLVYEKLAQLEWEKAAAQFREGIRKFQEEKE